MPSPRAALLALATPITILLFLAQPVPAPSVVVSLTEAAVGAAVIGATAGITATDRRRAAQVAYLQAEHDALVVKARLDRQGKKRTSQHARRTESLQVNATTTEAVDKRNANANTASHHAWSLHPRPPPSPRANTTAAAVAAGIPRARIQRCYRDLGANVTLHVHATTTTTHNGTVTVHGLPGSCLGIGAYLDDAQNGGAVPELCGPHCLQYTNVTDAQYADLVSTLKRVGEEEVVVEG